MDVEPRTKQDMRRQNENDLCICKRIFIISVALVPNSLGQDQE